VLRWCNLAEESSDKTVTSARLNPQFGVKIVAWPYSRWVAECLPKTFQPSQQDPTEPDDLPVGGIGERAPFYAAYTQASGRRVDPAHAYYWEVLGNVRWALGALGQARRHLSGLEPSIELASLGRVAAEMELETLNLIERYDREGTSYAR